MSTKREILVFANWLGLTEPFLMGVLTSERFKGKEIFAFNYNREWLNSNNALLIDPALKHFTGPQYVADDKINFGVFLDSAPDQWGRLLMRRRESF